LRSTFRCLLIAAAVLARDAEARENLAARIDAGWKVQQRWHDVAEKGGFEYEFDLKMWNSSNRLKGSEHRLVRVTHARGDGGSLIVSSQKDGKDDTVQARRDQARREEKERKEKKAEKKDEFPSPFDPKFRDRYEFRLEARKDDLDVVSFSPREALEGAVMGKVGFDAEDRPRKVSFGLAHPPIFTKNVSVAISLDTEGNPVRTDSSGNISILIWKRRFESTIFVRNVRPPASQAGSPPAESAGGEKARND
jgi:hypothetical protein